MNSSEHIQPAADPVTLRAGRPLMPVSPLSWPRTRRLHGIDVPRLTRYIPLVEISAGALLGLAVGIAYGVLRFSVADVISGMFFGPLFGLLIGWLIATFTGATGTLTLRTVLHNVVHIVWVLTVVIFCSGVVMLLAALADAAYGRSRQDF
jgi:hypothetical protein